jgi:hypothetical protein
MELLFRVDPKPRFLGEVRVDATSPVVEVRIAAGYVAVFLESNRIVEVR